LKICSGSRKLPSPWTGQIAILYLCRHVKGSPKPDNHEKDAARYFSYQDIESFPEPIDPLSGWIVDLHAQLIHSWSEPRHLDQKRKLN
jgi:hypothetical protein